MEKENPETINYKHGFIRSNCYIDNRIIILEDFNEKSMFHTGCFGPFNVLSCVITDDTQQSDYASAELSNPNFIFF